jgi:hypothetical protein
MATERELDQMSLQEIKDLAEQEQEQEQANAQPEDVVYTRTIGGVQYSSDSLEGLMDVVAAAAEATEAANKPAPAPAERTADEKFVLAQEFAASPSKAWDRMLLEKTGLTPSQFKAQVAATVDQENNACAEAFVASTPEFLANPTNGKILTDHLAKTGFGVGKKISVSNLRAAYEACKGLLQERPAEFDPWGSTLEELKAKTLGRPVQDFDEGF